MSNRVEISEFKESQIDELLSFLKKWAPEHPELATGDILRWQRSNNFIASYRGKIVGYIGQIPYDFKYGKPSHREGIEHFGWGVTLTLNLSNDNIRKKAGRGLLDRCENNPPLIFAGAGVIPTIEEPYKRRGHQIRRDCCRMYARFENPKKVLKYLSVPHFLAPLIKLTNLFRRVWIPIDDELIENINWIDRFESRWDHIWDRTLCRQYELYGIRNAEYLNHKLSQPNREYSAFWDSAGGYIILRKAIHPLQSLTLIKVCDLVGTSDSKKRLLRIGMKYLYHEKADGIVALGSAQDRKIYRSVGMYISKPYPVCLHKSIKAKIHISFFDSDLDNLW